MKSNAWAIGWVEWSLATDAKILTLDEKALLLKAEEYRAKITASLK